MWDAKQQQASQVVTKPRRKMGLTCDRSVHSSGWSFRSTNMFLGTITPLHKN